MKQTTEIMKNEMNNNCQRPELCLLSETCIPCAICPNAKDVNNGRSKNHNRTEAMNTHEIPTPIGAYRPENMNIDEIPTPETDRFFHYSWRTDRSWRAHSEDLERRLTVAREALERFEGCIDGYEYTNSAEKALALTTPKP